MLVGLFSSLLFFFIPFIILVHESDFLYSFKSNWIHFPVVRLNVYTVTWSCPFVNRHTMINLISFNGLFIALNVIIKIISLSLWCDKLDTIYENCNNNIALYKIKYFMITEFTDKWTMVAKNARRRVILTSKWLRFKMYYHLKWWDYIYFSHFIAKFYGRALVWILYEQEI